jgi:hypothetical protein
MPVVISMIWRRSSGLRNSWKSRPWPRRLHQLLEEVAMERGDDGDRQRRLHSADSPQRFDTVGAWHAKIQVDQIDLVVDRQLRASLAVVRCQEFNRLPTQCKLEGPANGSVVVND